MMAARQGFHLHPHSLPRGRPWADGQQQSFLKKGCSTSSVVHGCRGMVRRWSMVFWAQAYSNEGARRSSPVSMATRMSAAAEQISPGVVKWMPLSVSMVWIL